MSPSRAHGVEQTTCCTSRGKYSVPYRNRGFTRTNTSRGPATISPGRANDTSNRVPGAPVIPRTKSGPSPQSDPYQNPPPSWFGPVSEWAVWYDLVVIRKLQPGVDFAYQAALPAAGLNMKGFNRADYWVFPWGKAGAGGATYPQGIVINPITPFTHPSRAKDILERIILGRNGFLEIFIEGRDLATRAHIVVGLALRGIDVSSRGTGFYG